MCVSTVQWAYFLCDIIIVTTIIIIILIIWNLKVFSVLSIRLEWSLYLCYWCINECNGTMLFQLQHSHLHSQLLNMLGDVLVMGANVL